MKRIYLLALTALMLIAFAAVAAQAADNTCVVTKTESGEYTTVCPNCQAPAWDRTPVYVAPEGRGPAPEALAVDPWTLCGAYCQAGQVPAGWPYGWTSQYWLRPDSNL